MTVKPTLAEKIVEAIAHLTLEKGRPPLRKELAAALGQKSDGPISRALVQLRREGIVQSGVFLVPPATCPHCAGALTSYVPALRPQHQRRGLADKIRASDPSTSPEDVAEALGTSARYVMEIRRRAALAARQAAAEAHAGEPVVLAYDDPRHAAWLQYWRNQGDATRAQTVERFRQPIEVPSCLPPESPDVLFAGGRYTIPFGTPEWASHIARLRRRGPHGARQAMNLSSSRGDLFENQRWGIPENRGG